MIETLWKLCKEKQYTNKTLISMLKKDPQLKVILKDFLKTIKGDDELVLFNWFIGSVFLICVKEL